MATKEVWIAIAVFALVESSADALPWRGSNEVAVIQHSESTVVDRATAYLRQLWTARTTLVTGHLDDSNTQIWPEFKFSVSLVMGTVIGMFGSALGTIGGVGGGVFYLPMLNFLLGFDAKTSTALSKAMVMGASAASAGFNLREKHPTETQPVINYDCAMLLQPMILLGISIGVILNVMLPEWLVTALLVILFSHLAWRSFQRATRMWENETNIQNDKLKTSLILACSSEEPENGDYIDVSSCDGVNLVLPENVQETLVTWKWFFWRKMALLVFVWGVFLVLQMINAYVPDCSLWFWVATAMQVPVAFGATTWEALHQQKEGQRESDGEEEDNCFGDGETEVKKNWQWKLIFSFLGLAAGAVGGLLGVGGGGIMSPAFLEFGLPPQVSSATATFIMVFSSSLSVAEYYFLGRLPGDFAIYFTLTSMVAAILGQAIIKKVIQASGKQSIIVFILGACCASGLVVLGVMGAERSYNHWKAGDNMGFQDLCASE